MRRRTGRPLPPHTAKPSTVAARPPQRTKRPPRPGPRLALPKPALRAPRTPARSRQIARIMDDEDASLLDVVDNLLARGVMLNADLILALANVDLVYVRVSALLCAADRVLPPSRFAGMRAPEAKPGRRTPRVRR
jgi:Gas vesicle protein